MAVPTVVEIHPAIVKDIHFGVVNLTPAVVADWHLAVVESDPAIVEMVCRCTGGVVELTPLVVQMLMLGPINGGKIGENSENIPGCPDWDARRG